MESWQSTTSNSSATPQEKFTPGFLLHLYDELAESQPNATVKDYEAFLVRWGMDSKKARVCCSQISSNENKRLTREQLCKGLNFSPEQPAGLREVEILCRDMSIRMSESLQVIVLNALNSHSSKKAYLESFADDLIEHEQDVVSEIKREIENVYGPRWNVFIANGRYWAINTHKPGCNLVFAYRGVVYGVYQSPERNVNDSQFTSNSSYAAVSSAH